jgi:molecular chaperone GrpE
METALRARAELENVRRRAERDVANAHRYGLERFVNEFLPVRDSLELGVSAAGDDADIARVREGMELTLKLMAAAFDKLGLDVVDPAGEPFDPELHQAMTMQEGQEGQSGSVLTVVQKGYRLNERLVRPALVVVAK